MVARVEREVTTLPQGWLWTTVGEIAEVIRGASPRPKGDPRYFGGSIPWIMISDVTRASGKFISQTRDSVTEGGAKRSRYLEAGTLILSNSATVCVPKIMAVAGCIHDGFVAFPNLTKDLDILYLYYYFEYIRPRVIQENRQGITQVNLNTTIVRELAVPLAPLPEQHRIVAEIEKQFTRLDAGVTALKRAQANLKRYKAAVLKAACEGKLARSAQDPNDELASVLLQRVQHERAKRELEGQSKGRTARGKAESKQGVAKMKKTKERRPLWDTLVEAKARLTPKELFDKAGFTAESVDEFYEELRDEVLRKGRIRQHRPNDTDVYLEAVKE